MLTFIQKLRLNMPLRIALTLACGIAISAVVFFVLISIGYAHISTSSDDVYQVFCCGLPIYNIRAVGDGFLGESVDANMSILGASFSFLLSILVEALLGFVTHKNM